MSLEQMQTQQVALCLPQFCTCHHSSPSFGRHTMPEELSAALETKRYPVYTAVVY